MTLQFEALLPFAIIGTALALAGPTLDYTHRLFHNGKPRRRMMDGWDKAMVARDTRITGAEHVQMVKAGLP